MLWLKQHNSLQIYTWSASVFQVSSQILYNINVASRDSINSAINRGVQPQILSQRVIKLFL